LGLDISLHGEMLRRGLKVLADAYRVAACGLEVHQGLFDFLRRLAASQHEGRFDEAALAEFPCDAEHFQRLVVGKAPITDAAEHTPDGFNIVAEDLGGRSLYERNVLALTVEILDQYFDRGLRHGFFYRSDCLGDMARAAIGEV